MQAAEEDSGHTLTKALKGALFKALFIFASAFLVFDSLRNSLTWYLGKFWSSSGDVWQQLWNKVLLVIGEDPFLIDVPWTFLFTSTVLWSIGSIYCYFDVTNKPNFLRKYKIQPGTNEPVDPKKFRNLIQTVFFNTTVVGIPLLYLGHLAHQWRGRPNLKILPEFHRVVLELAVFSLVEEVMFFYSHWALHHKLIYKYIHKKHHEWTASVSFVGRCTQGCVT